MQFVSRRAGLLVLLGFIVLKRIKSTNCCKILKFHFQWIVVPVTDNSNININVKAKMEVCSKAPLSRNPHYVEASWLFFNECQMTGLHMTQNLTDGSRQTDLNIFMEDLFVDKWFSNNLSWLYVKKEN